MQRAGFEHHSSSSLYNGHSGFNDSEVENFTSQLEQVFSKLDQIERVYASYTSRYRALGDQSLIKQIHSLEISKRDLEMQRDILSEKLLTSQKRMSKNIYQPEQLSVTFEQSFNKLDPNNPNLKQSDFRQVQSKGKPLEDFEQFKSKDDYRRQDSDAFVDSYNKFNNMRPVIHTKDMPEDYRASYTTNSVEPEFNNVYNKIDNQNKSRGIPYRQEKTDSLYDEEMTRRHNKFNNQVQLSNSTYEQNNYDLRYEEESTKFNNREQVSNLQYKPNEVRPSYYNKEEFNDKEGYVGVYEEYNERYTTDIYEEEFRDEYKNMNSSNSVIDVAYRRRQRGDISPCDEDYAWNEDHRQEENHPVFTQVKILENSQNSQIKPCVRSTRNVAGDLDVWSMDVYNHVNSRTLDKRKYVNPASLLGSNVAELRRYNYTYFNDQPPEEVQVFEYTVDSPHHDQTSLVNHRTASPIVTTSSSKITPTFPIKFTPVQPPSNTKDPSIIHINDILSRSEDSRHVIILRGLPGSGKSSFCQSFKNKELSNGHSAPRILSIDHFFMEDGKYEYDAAMEATYRAELFKMFKRQIDEGFFSVILVDSINDKVEHFNQFYYYAKMNRFQPLVLDLKVSPTICAKRSEHKFNPKEIYQLADHWEETPFVFMTLDATSFLQDSDIEDVEMEDAAEDVIVLESSGEEEEDEVLESGFFKSKWDEDFEETKERLDGRVHLGHEENVFNINDFLKVEEDEMYKTKASLEKGGEKPGVKTVKWADFEELKRQKKRKELGFVAGYTDWNKIMGDDIAVAEAALVQIRHFVKD